MRGVVALVALAGLALAVSTVLTYRTASRVVEDRLQREALTRARTLAASLSALGARDARALQTLVATQQDRDLAYMAVLEGDGLVLAHSNPELVGRRQVDERVRRASQTHMPITELVLLGTGEEVYELTLPLRLPDAAATHLRFLRVALHTSAARWVLREAEVHALIVGLLLLLVGVLAAYELLTLRRYVALQAAHARRERLAVLGEMAAVLAHEIRNPLAALKGLAQYLHERQGGEAGSAEVTEAMVREARRLEQLAADLLEYARPRPIQRGEVKLEALLDELVARFQPEAQAVGVLIHREGARDLPPIPGDAERLRQVFTNLMVNALQAMPRGGVLAVQVLRAGRPGTVVVTIKDRGEGISPDDLSQIFSPFFTRRPRGTGLGLAIARQIVEQHGGTITVQSVPGQGTRFAVTLPAQEEAGV